MTRKNKNETSNSPVPKEVLEQLKKGTHPGIIAVWKKAESAKKPDPKLSNSEIEDALARVHMQLENKDSKPKSMFSGRIPQYTRYLVAAVALIVLSALFLFVPRTATVPYGEMALLELPDGTEIEMNSGTSIRYSRLYRFTDRRVQLNGEAYFIVAEHAHPFIVDANGVSVEVTGTRFNVRSWRDDPSAETTVTVSGGQVLFYPHHNKENQISLVSGESSRWNPGLAEPSEPESVTIEDFLAWRDQRFVFRDQTLISILRELERRYNTSIELDVPGIEHSTLTAYYSQQVPLEAVLDDICTVKGLRYTQTTNGYRIFD
jgi:transmembrane sensor